MNGISKRVFPSGQYSKYFEGMVVIIVDDEEHPFKGVEPYFTDLSMKCVHCAKTKELENGMEPDTADILKELENVLKGMEQDSADILLVVDLQLNKKQSTKDWENLGGYKLIKELRDNKNKKQYPIVVITNYIMDVKISPLLEELGVITVLQKQDNPQYLADAILASFLPYYRSGKKIAKLESEKCAMKETLSKAIYHQLSPALNRLSAELSSLEKEFPAKKDIIQGVQDRIGEVRKTKGLNDAISREINKIGSVELVPLNLYCWAKEWASQWNTHEGKSHKVEITISPPLKNDVMVSASPDVLKLVMDHLADNAVFAVRERKQKNISVEVSSSNQQGYASLKIRDNGPGFQDFVLEKVFKEKVTTRNITSREDEEHGVGLSLCSKLVGAVLKGFLNISNVKDKNGACQGAEVEIQLPIFKEKRG